MFKMKSKLLLSVLLMSLFSCSKQEDPRVLEIDKVLKRLYAERNFNGNVLIAEKGKIVYEKSFGLSNIETNKALTPESIFDIHSISKTFTAVSIMILEEKRLLSLDDDIKKYFPDFPYSNIAIKNLLTHTSGLFRIQTNPFLKEIARKELYNKEIIEVYKRIKPKVYFDAGMGHKYANTNYVLLALIIEKVSGTDYHDFVNKNIIQKSGMENTFLERERVPENLQNRVVSYYGKPKWLLGLKNVKNIQEYIDDQLTFENNYGESDVHTTARDLLKYHNSLMNGNLINNQSLAKMYAPFIPVKDKEFLNSTKSNYPSIRGLSWNIAKDSTMGKIVFHSGGTMGGRTFLIRNISKDQCVILLSNNDFTNRYTYTTPMRILNGLSYQLDRESLPDAFVREYLKNGIDSSLMVYNKFNNNENYIQFTDWDFEEIGEELMERGENKSAIRLFELYSKQFPNDEWSYNLLGDAYLKEGNKNEALTYYERALEINPESKYAIEMIQKLRGT